MRRLILGVVAVGLLSGAGTGIAQDRAAPAAPPEAAPLKIANRTVIVLRGPLAGYRAQERADAAHARIRDVLGAQGFPAIRTEELPEGTRVLIGGVTAFVVRPIDIDADAGETTAVVARAAVKRLEEAIAARAEQRSPRYLATAALISLAATLVLAVLVWALLWLRRRADARVAAAASEQTRRLQAMGFAFGTGQVLAVTRPLVRFVAWLAVVVLACVWLAFVLEQFPYTMPYGERLGDELFNLFGRAGLAVIEALPGLLLVVVIFVIARAVNRTAKLLFDRVESGHVKLGWLDANAAGPTRRISAIVVWIFALAMAYPYLPGADTEAFKGLSVLVGLMISLGGAGMIGQAFAGLAVMYNGAIRAGEYVRIGEVEGTVVELGMMMTRIRTGLGEVITLPNSTLTSTPVKNYSRAFEGTGFVLDTTVTIGYATPWRQVHAMLIEAALRTAGVVKENPEPHVRQTGLSDFYVQYRLIAYSSVRKPGARAEVLNDLHANIQDVFNEYGVQIMSPNYEADPPEPQVVPKDKWFAAPAKPTT
jgi:small-conductance mechanosensitive channel